MIPDKSQPITAPTGENIFQLRLIKDEGVGLLTTHDKKSYLLLDSLDYWYDLIQTEYPKKRKCSCKNEWYTVKIDYWEREGTSDYHHIRVITTCTQCNKASTALSIDIKYSPTEHLFQNPITYCEKPKIKYKYAQLTSYWDGNDLKNFLHFIFHDLQLNVYCWYFARGGIRYFDQLTPEKAIEIVTVNHRYLDFLFSKQAIDLSGLIAGYNDMGVYLKKDPWRKNEIIQLSAPTVIMGYGLLFHINYCSQHLDRGNVVDKSPEFATITAELQQWLTSSFITLRGKHCYDGHEAYKKYSAKRNS